MENTNQNHAEPQGFLPFDPIVLVRDVVKRWLLILLAVLVFGTGAYIMTDMDYKPAYKATTTFVVVNRSSSSNVYTNLSTTTSVASVFSALLNSSQLRELILQELGQTSFDGSISAAVIPETNLLTVTVTASDPRTAFMVSQTIIEHHGEMTYKVVDNVALEVLQTPKVPTAPSNRANASGQMKRVMLFAAIGVVFLLAVLSYMRNTIRSGKEARSKLDCEYLGEIAHEKKYRTLLSWLRRRKSGILITNPITSFSYVESVRKLRRRVEQQLHGRKVLMVASLLENEGKSTVAVNLALSLAQKYKKVLLIDCDLRKPACHILMDRKSTAYGLRDVLTGGIDISDALIQDKKSNLFMLLETHAGKDSETLLSSEKMEQLLQWARDQFDYVVLDLPPMAMVSDAEALMELADASILVVRQNAAAAPVLNKAIATLEKGKAKLLGCVLNDVYSTRLSSGQGYGYGYGYGYGKYGHYGKYGKYGSYGHYGSSK